MTGQGKSLDRKKLLADPVMVAAIAGIFLFLFLFILYPLAILLSDSAVVETENGTAFWNRQLYPHL